jgi:hypothetical protein
MTVPAYCHHRVTAYQKAKDLAKARSAAITLAGQDIAPTHRPRTPAGGRGRIGTSSLPAVGRFFCEAYFPHLFTSEWTQDHLRVIAKIERVVRYR